MPLALTEGTTSAINDLNLADVITADMLSGVFNQVIYLLPVCLPVMVLFAGFRKGLGFVKSVLYSA